MISFLLQHLYLLGDKSYIHMSKFVMNEVRMKMYERCTDPTSNSTTTTTTTTATTTNNNEGRNM
jgi:hypothetical protein